MGYSLPGTEMLTMMLLDLSPQLLDGGCTQMQVEEWE